MKKLILIIALALANSIAFAQKTENKVEDQSQTEHKVDPGHIYTITLKLTSAEISLLTMTPEEWKLIKCSPKLSGEQITNIEATAQQIKKNINNQRIQLMQTDYLKSRANTSSLEERSNTNN